MRIVQAVSVSLFAVVAFVALTAASAAAFHPLFLTQSGKALLFTGEGDKFLQLHLNEGVLFEISCEHTLVHGSALSKSTLAHGVKLELSGKCEQTAGTTKTACNEPIQLVSLLGELGLVSSTNKKVVLLLAPSSGTEFYQVTCGGSTFGLEGAVVAEFPEVNAKGVNQYNKQLSEAELVFESENKSENQKITEIFLLGTQMTKAELKITGFFGGKASWETVEALKFDGSVEISTH